MPATLITAISTQVIQTTVTLMPATLITAISTQVIQTTVTLMPATLITAISTQVIQTTVTLMPATLITAISTQVIQTTVTLMPATLITDTVGTRSRWTRSRTRTKHLRVTSTRTHSALRRHSMPHPWRSRLRASSLRDTRLLSISILRNSLPATHRLPNSNSSNS